MPGRATPRLLMVSQELLGGHTSDSSAVPKLRSYLQIGCSRERGREFWHPTGLQERGHRDHPDAGASAEGERDRRAPRPYRPLRVSRLAAAAESTPPRG